MDFGNPKKLHFAAGVAASLGYIGLSNYDRIQRDRIPAGLGDMLPTKRGKAGVLSFFNYLNRIKQAAQPHLRPLSRHSPQEPNTKALPSSEHSSMPPGRTA